MIEISRYLNGYLNLIVSKRSKAIKSRKEAVRCSVLELRIAFLYDEHALINQEIGKHNAYNFILAVQ